MSEANFWQEIQSGMTGRWHAQRHEDKHSMGVPDVSYALSVRAPEAGPGAAFRWRADGWIELKYLPGPPKGRKPWDFKLDHFTPEQRNWLTLRSRAGRGMVFLMCRFGPGLAAIWNWKDLEPVLGVGSFNDILGEANAVWRACPINWQDLAEILATSNTKRQRSS